MPFNWITREIVIYLKYRKIIIRLGFGTIIAINLYRNRNIITGRFNVGFEICQ